MEEMLADTKNHCQPTQKLIRLYDAWGRGGAGLILSGHIMIDPTAMAAPADLLLSDDIGQFDEQIWHEWISLTKQNGAQFWFQINHPGRQLRKDVDVPAYGPSVVAMNMGRMSSMFGVPREMTEEHIQDVIHRFVRTAQKAEQLGVDGVQVHAAHGYLISSFLSPLSNQRKDRWGGSLENRSRLLFEVVKGIRKVVSPKFGVAVKINTADFQRGGFEEEDLFWVVQRLDRLGIDFVEVSGGNYESPAMAGHKQTQSTMAREAYFLKTAKALQDFSTMPIMVTGGIRHRETVDAVAESGDNFLVGVGTALGLIPDLVNRWERGEDPAPSVSKSWVLSDALSSAGKTMTVMCNLQLIANGWRTWHGLWPVLALLIAAVREQSGIKHYKRWAMPLLQKRNAELV